MSFEVEIIKEERNPLIDRTEIEFKLEHFGEGTPNRLDVQKKIAALKNANEKYTIITKIKTHFGSAYAIGKAHVYEDAKELEFYEPFHVRVRNLPLEKRNEIYQLKRKNEPFKHLFE